MAKRKKASKVEKRAKARRASSAKRVTALRRAQAKTVAKTKAKRKPAKKTAPRVKKPAAETVIVDLIEQPAPGVITVTEIEETVRRDESPSPG
jgi:hypothetical protein